MAVDLVDDPMDLDPPEDEPSPDQRPEYPDATPVSGGMFNGLCTRLVRPNAIGQFIRNFEPGLRHWSALLNETSPPDNITSADSRFITAFKTLDRVITAGEIDSAFLSRMAYVQLIRVMKLLEYRVAIDRQAGRLHRRSGYQNASVVLDIYLSAQEDVSPSSSRLELIGRKRRAKRWSELAGPWPIFLLVYSEEAEDIMFDPINRVSLVVFADNECSQKQQLPDTNMLRMIAARVFRESPPQLLAICEQAACATEYAVSTRRPVNDLIVKKLLFKCRTEL